MIYKVLFKGGGTYILSSLENVSVLSQLLKIDFDQSYESFSRIKTIAFCRRHQAEEVTVKTFEQIALLRCYTIKTCQNWSGNFTSISTVTCILPLLANITYILKPLLNFNLGAVRISPCILLLVIRIKFLCETQYCHGSVLSRS